MSGYVSPSAPPAVSPPRRMSTHETSPSSRAPRLSTPSRLQSIASNQPLALEDIGPSRTSMATSTTTVIGFSPKASQGAFPQTGSPILSPHILLNTAKANAARPLLSPHIASPSDSSFPFGSSGEPASPRAQAPSPRGLAGDFPARSRRNSAAIVSISLSSRSRSRTPRGSASVLPARSGSGTPSKTTTPKGDSGLNMFSNHLGDSWAPGVEEMDDWVPAGGMLLDGDDEETFNDEREDAFGYDDEYYDDKGRSWTGDSDAGRAPDVLRPGMIFGEGLEFEGDVVEPAIGRLQVSGAGASDVGLPLRRGGSEAGAQGVRDASGRQTKKKYEVVRQLGSGSYAVVYLVRECGGRKREYALKCLSKHDLEEEQLETQLFEATIHLSLPIHTNIVTLHQTLQTRNWLFLMLELCPGEDLFYWLEKSRDASPPPASAHLPDDGQALMSSSRFSSSSIPFSSSQLFSNFSAMPSSYSNSPGAAFSPSYGASPASLLFAHHNNSSLLHSHQGPGSIYSHAQTPPTPSLLSAFSANTLLTQRRLKLIASMFSQMCEAVAVCHDAGISHRDIKPENFICCDSVELEAVAEGDDLDESKPDFGPQAKRKVIVKLTDFGLATTEEESGDVECGSKPYMSYECRNNLGPTYRPSPADVWSLGIVLINMLFHRNPWKDPTDGDANFDSFLGDPTGFFQAKFTGIGKEVASYLAQRVLAVEVDDRVSARELGQWVRSLPEMIGGRRAVHALKMARLDTARTKDQVGDKSLFVKSPVQTQAEQERKNSFASGLTSSAPLLSSLPPPSDLVNAALLPTPDLEDRDEIKSATTVDDHPTPTDMSALVSPEPTENGELDDLMSRNEDDDGEADILDTDSRSYSTHKRRKRGVRKGKAAQAALAAAAAGDIPTQQERDALLAELAAASQSLARDLSKRKPIESFDSSRVEDFPPLGTTPAQAAAARKSKWKDFMSMSKGNPQLEALARRVAERDSSTGGNWSAPAQLQQGKNPMSRPAFNKQTATTSSGFSSQLSSIATVSSGTGTSSSGGGPDEDDWRRPARLRDEDKSYENRPRRATEDNTLRARQAALAAAAITGGMETMGAFGKRSELGRAPNRHPPRSNLNHASSPLSTIADERFAPVSVPLQTIDHHETRPIVISQESSPNSSGFTIHAPSSSVASSSTITTTTVTTTISQHQSTSHASTPHMSPNKPKLKGQIHSLAKMLGGLKTKGRD